MKRNIAPWMTAFGLIVGLSAWTNPDLRSRTTCGRWRTAWRWCRGGHRSCRRRRTWGGTGRRNRWRCGCAGWRHYHAGTSVWLRLLSGTGQLLWLLQILIENLIINTGVNTRDDLPVER